MGRKWLKDISKYLIFQNTYPLHKRNYYFPLPTYPTKQILLIQIVHRFPIETLPLLIL